MFNNVLVIAVGPCIYFTATESAFGPHSLTQVRPMGLRVIERVMTSRLLGSTVWHWSRALYALEHVDLCQLKWQPARVSGESTGPHNGPLRPVVTPESGTFTCPIPGEQPLNF